MPQGECLVSGSCRSPVGIRSRRPQGCPRCVWPPNCFGPPSSCRLSLTQPSAVPMTSSPVTVPRARVVLPTSASPPPPPAPLPGAAPSTVGPLCTILRLILST